MPELVLALSRGLILRVMLRSEKTTPYTSFDCSERDSVEEVLVGAAEKVVVPASIVRLCEVDQSAWNRSEQCRS